MRILIVEDEEDLAASLARGLREQGFAVDVAHDGGTGLHKALLTPYDVVVLDRDLPVLHGDVLCERLVGSGHGARVLMLTAAADLDDLVAGFSIGADDYLAKPFRFAEVVARIHALTRRPAVSAQTILRAGDIELDPSRQRATRSGTDLRLTLREFAVLTVLVRAEGRIVSSEELLERAWDEHADPFTTSVRVMVSRLRAKLGSPDPITTIVGKGYRLCADA